MIYREKKKKNIFLKTGNEQLHKEKSHFEKKYFNKVLLKEVFAYISKNKILKTKIA